MKILFAALLPACLLSACATYQPDAVCDINSSTGLPVLRPASFGANISTSQHVVINSRNGKFEFIAQMEVDTSRIVLVAMSLPGQKLFQISYQGDDIDFQSWGVPLDFDPGYLLSDLSFIFGSSSALQVCMQQRDSGLHIKENSKGQKRQVTGDLLNAIIEYSSQTPWSGQINYRNETLGYQIDINMLQSSRL